MAKKENKEKDLEKEWKKLKGKIKKGLKSKTNEKPKEETKEKKEQESEKEESELEEGIEESERVLEESEFHEFIPSFPISSESFVPVLQRAERRQQEETLEENLSSSARVENKTDDMIKYSMSGDYSSQEKRKYQEGAVVLRNIETAQEFRKLPKQELLNPFDWIMTNQWGVERDEKIDAEFIREEAKLPFEKKDKKYKEFKL